ncbi:MAG: hypothetical protein Kow0063_02700 [Anaerolineae bacterium]
MKTSSVAQKILFVHNVTSAFVTIDLQLLRERWDVQEWHERGRVTNLPALIAAVRRCDLVFGWFASWHTFWPITLARLMRKPSVLVIGGYDVANIPDIGYGHQSGGLKQWVSRWIIHRAKKLITISLYSQQEIDRNIGSISQRTQVIYLGFSDPFESCALFEQERSNTAITIGHVAHTNLARKGHEAFVRAAAFLPQTNFVLIGDWRDDSIDYLRRIAPDNVSFTGWLTREQINDYLQSASVYVQASRHEGFGMAVAEAMLAGCIPVVTRAGALPEVVGDTGIYINSDDPKEIAFGVEQALKSGRQARQKARERILIQFPLERRRQGLHKIVEELLGQ